MKAILEFTLPEEQANHEDALNGGSYKAILQDMDNHLRSLIKYGDLSEELQTQAEEIRTKLHQTAEAYDLTVWG